MVRFENIPFVFELARIHKGCASDPKFSMNYEEYSKYSKIFDELPPSGKAIVVEKTKMRRKLSCDSTSGSDGTKESCVQ